MMKAQTLLNLYVEPRVLLNVDVFFCFFQLFVVNVLLLSIAATVATFWVR